MAEDLVDHLAVAEQAARLHDLAIRRSDEGRRDEALSAAEEAVGLYRTLADDFPAMFGADAERADSLAAAIREDRPRASTGVPAARPSEPADDTTTAGVSAPGTERVVDEPGAVATPEPEPPVPAPRPVGRSRRRTVVVSAIVLAVLLGAVGAAGWAVSRPHAPAPVAVQPPPAPVPARPWTATARIDVAPSGVTLRSAPSTAGAPVGRLAPGADVQIQCGEIGRVTSSGTGERSSSWLRTVAGNYLAAVNVDVRGPSPMANCKPGQPPVPLPHHG